MQKKSTFNQLYQYSNNSVTPCWLWSHSSDCRCSVAVDMKTSCEVAARGCNACLLLTTHAASASAPQGATRAESPPSSSQRSCWQEQPVSKPSPSIPLPCLRPVHLHQADGRDPHGGITLSFTPPEAAVWGAWLTRAQPISTGKHPLPISNAEAWEASDSHRYCQDLITASPRAARLSHSSSCWKAEHEARTGTQSHYRLIWHRLPNLAPCLHHTGLVTAAGLPERTEDYSFQIMYCSIHLQKYLVVKPSHHLLN